MKLKIAPKKEKGGVISPAQLLNLLTGPNASENQEGISYEKNKFLDGYFY